MGDQNYMNHNQSSYLTEKETEKPLLKQESNRRGRFLITLQYSHEVPGNSKK